jgi:ribulose-phosphate 3-epimerase
MRFVPITHFHGGNMKKSIRIVPAVLTEDPASLKVMLEQAADYTDFVQIDIMDGVFVPSHSITWKDILPIRKQPQWEVHLMIKNPEKEFANYQKAGTGKVVFHFEATKEHQKVIQTARNLKLKVGMAINPETTITQVMPLLDSIDSVLFMSVHPGFYGAKFLPEVLDKVRELHHLKPSLLLSIDGGINENNLLEVAKTGVQEICVGSGIFRQADPAAAYRKLTALVNKR